ncbi:peptide-N(4)-(N-acetyl-beta-glucosaminyl)asparagine amidase-like [Rhododendron vialii]|uniref:peptide-N(4)-(N-acetyl-beta- glucosaminyl)asparagine amidase-like n=1 Tax=Rhododendron vialii TaxID=182163 RepID=UPI00265E5C5D|nr:peptide-N(4)-(N-acetyl-beta-glucosaminyl)asparagine amidase-like [Rhododendron vialii]
MVARRFLVRFHDEDFYVDYDTDRGLEVFKFQVFSLTLIPPEEQKIFGIDDDRLLLDDSDLASVSDRLRVVSIADEVEQGEKSVDQNAEMARFDEDLARTLQAEVAALVRIKKEEEEEALMLQQSAASDGNSLMDARIRPYVDRVRGREEGWISLGPWGELRDKEYWDYKPEGPIMQITISYGYAIASVLFESKSYDGAIIGSSVKVAGTGGDGSRTKTVRPSFLIFLFTVPEFTNPDRDVCESIQCTWVPNASGGS